MTNQKFSVGEVALVISDCGRGIRECTITGPLAEREFNILGEKMMCYPIDVPGFPPPFGSPWLASQHRLIKLQPPVEMIADEEESHV